MLGREPKKNCPKAYCRSNSYVTGIGGLCLLFGQTAPQTRLLGKGACRAGYLGMGSLSGGGVGTWGLAKSTAANTQAIPCKCTARASASFGHNHSCAEGRVGPKGQAQPQCWLMHQESPPGNKQQLSTVSHEHLCQSCTIGSFILKKWHGFCRARICRIFRDTEHPPPTPGTRLPLTLVCTH